jgi:hypothetical protein
MFQPDSNYYHQKNTKSGKRPQSANIRITKDRGAKNKLMRNTNPNQEIGFGEEGITHETAPDVKAYTDVNTVYRENALTNGSQFNKSPSKFQK